MKTLRHRAILSIIATRPVHSQEELMRFLQEGGYEATQATVSRDIKELGLVKVPLKNGNGNGTHFKYIEPGFGKSYESRLHRVVADLVRHVSGSLNDIVLRTPPGSAMLVASAVDEAGWNEVIGTVGGDDTVLVILDDPAHLPVVKQRFQDMRSENPL